MQISRSACRRPQAHATPAPPTTQSAAHISGKARELDAVHGGGAQRVEHERQRAQLLRTAQVFCHQGGIHGVDSSYDQELRVLQERTAAGDAQGRQ